MHSNSTSFDAPKTLVIASRQSRLALWQAQYVSDALQKLYPEAQIEILGMTTRGDQILDRTLSKVGGKGLFVKELEYALADGRAHLAVHSLKDVPMSLPAGFKLAAILERADPRDAFVSPYYASLAALPAGSVVGTSSLRREAMVRAGYPHLKVQPLRGNLDTRLRKLDAGEYAAIIVAAAGLIRLDLTERIRVVLEPAESLPAAGQGALGLEICADQAQVEAWLAPLHHSRTAFAVEAERAVSGTLGGSCEVPLAAFAKWDGEILSLAAHLAMPDGRQRVSAQGQASPATLAQASALGRSVAAELVKQGAHEMMQALSSHTPVEVYDENVRA